VLRRQHILHKVLFWSNSIFYFGKSPFLSFRFPPKAGKVGQIHIFVLFLSYFGLTVYFILENHLFFLFIFHQKQEKQAKYIFLYYFCLILV